MSDLSQVLRTPPQKRDYEWEIRLREQNINSAVNEMFSLDRAKVGGYEYGLAGYVVGGIVDAFELVLGGPGSIIWQVSEIGILNGIRSDSEESPKPPQSDAD